VYYEQRIGLFDEWNPTILSHDQWQELSEGP